MQSTGRVREQQVWEGGIGPEQLRVEAAGRRTEKGE